MRVSREQVGENRRAILEAAGRLFRERGFDGVTVAEIMQAAGLTHGGFYGYFRSKDELIAAAVDEALASREMRADDFSAYVEAYLSAAHVADRACGCATAALAAEAARPPGAAKAAMTAGLARQIDRLAAIAPGKTAKARRRAAVGSWAAMVGAVILARMSDDPLLSAEVLAQTRAWIEDSK